MTNKAIRLGARSETPFWISWFLVPLFLSSLGYFAIGGRNGSAGMGGTRNRAGEKQIFPSRLGLECFDLKCCPWEFGRLRLNRGVDA